MVRHCNKDTMTELAIHDPSVATEPRSAVSRWLATLINDKRDVRVLAMQLLTFIVMVGSATLVYLHFTWWTALLHVVLFIVLMGPHTITLHLMSHRRFFKQKVAWLEVPLLHILGIFFGHTPRSYFSHHIGMHHVEGGLDPDKSCTHHFQRDSLKDFLRYVGRFLFVGFKDLQDYLTRRKMDKLKKELVVGDRVYWIIIIALAIFNWKATLVVFLFSLLYTRFIMMAGNWGQHSLVDPDQPDNVYRNTVTCINAFYNTWCYNDGYHVSHHNHPTMHWMDHPKNFLKNKQAYIDNDAVVFHTVDFFGVWFLLVTRQYRTLASYYVHLGEQQRSVEDIVQLIKRRTESIPAAP